MDWPEFRQFLLRQIRLSKNTRGSSSQPLSPGYPPEWDNMISSSNLDSASDESRSINWSGIGEMYKQHLFRTSADAVKALGGSAYIETTSRTTGFSSGATRSAFRSSLYRRLPMVMAATGAYRQYRFALTAIDDISSGYFPGTDEPFFD